MLIQLLNGFLWGWIIALVALGLNLIYGILGIVNVAHGTFYMLGAVVALTLLPYVGFWGALIAAVIIVAIIGVACERVVLRPLLNNPVMTILATFGLLLALEQTVALTFGPTARAMTDPLGWTFELDGTTYSGYRVVVALCAVITIIGVELFLQRTRWGSWIRAVNQNHELAAVQGVPVPQVYSLTFGLGTGLAALAGVLVAPIVGVHFTMGFNIIILAFVVVIVGGTGSLWGTVLVAIGAAELENLLILITRPTAARMITFIVLGLLLVIRPQGLFGRR
ncbi:MAG: branched-chain amino acid ABC transporter permease [Chloroflexota bacterium]